MMTRCQICGLNYNDTYRWTFCPHDKFEPTQTARELLERQGIPVEEPETDRPYKIVQPQP